jgi:hypothetical protein
MEEDNRYADLETSYPNPFTSSRPQLQHSQREMYNQPPDQRARFKVIEEYAATPQPNQSYPQQQYQPRQPPQQYQREIDPRDQYPPAYQDNPDYYAQPPPQQRSLYNEQARVSMPTYHTLPNPEQARYIPPYQHAMKRPGNNERMQEIFGDNQNYGGMGEMDLNYGPGYRDNQGREEFGSNPMTSRQQSPQQYQQLSAQPGNYQTPPNRPPQLPMPRMKFIEGDDPRQTQQPLVMANIPPHKRQIYNAIIEYFPGFFMTKTATFGQFSVWKGVISCLLCDGMRYIVAITKDDTSPKGTKKPLTMLPWESFQTRYSESDKEQREQGLSSHQYAKPDRTILDDTIHLSRKTTTSNLYDCDNLPLSVEIIRGKPDEDLAEHGTVASALELFSTVLTFLE